MTQPKSHEGINQSQAFTAKDRLLHMKKKDNQSTGSNSKQWTPKWLLRQRRKKHKEKSEFRDVKEAAAVKPVLMLHHSAVPQPFPWRKKKDMGQFEQLFSGEWGAAFRVELQESHLECASMGDFSAIYPSSRWWCHRGAFKNRTHLISHRKDVHRDVVNSF